MNYFSRSGIQGSSPLALSKFLRKKKKKKKKSVAIISRTRPHRSSFLDPWQFYRSAPFDRGLNQGLIRGERHIRITESIPACCDGERELFIKGDVRALLSFVRVTYSQMTLIALTNPTRSSNRSHVRSRKSLRPQTKNLIAHCHRTYSIELGPRHVGGGSRKRGEKREEKKKDKKKEISAFDALSGAARNNALQKPTMFLIRLSIDDRSIACQSCRVIRSALLIPDEYRDNVAFRIAATCTRPFPSRRNPEHCAEIDRKDIITLYPVQKPRFRGITLIVFMKIRKIGNFGEQLFSGA